MTSEIVDLTIDLRKKNRITIADAVIFATTKALGATLITRNISDFDRIDDVIEVINPFND